MTPEQNARYEELLNKENLTEDEKTELADLEALQPEDPEQDEFDKAWEDLDGDNTATDDGSDSTAADDDTTSTDDSDKDGSGDNGTEDTSQQSDDGSDASTPDNDSDGQASDTDDDDSTEETPEQKIARLEAENQKLNHKMSSWDGRIKKETELRKAAEAKLNEKDSDGSDDVTPEEDDKELKDFFEEYPDLEKPIKTVAEKIATKIVEKRMGKVEQKVDTVVDSQQADADEKHINAIKEAHPDWENIYKSGALTKWISNQPEILQSRYEEIVNSGKTSEVIGMFDQYKESTGKKEKTTTQTSSQSEGKKKKLKDMEAVPPSSTLLNTDGKGGMPDKDDFDASWNHFTKDEK